MNRENLIWIVKCFHHAFLIALHVVFTLLRLLKQPSCWVLYRLYHSTVWLVDTVISWSISTINGQLQIRAGLIYCSWLNNFSWGSFWEHKKFLRLNDRLGRCHIYIFYFLNRRCSVGYFVWTSVFLRASELTVPFLKKQMPCLFIPIKDHTGLWNPDEFPVRDDLLSACVKHRPSHMPLILFVFKMASNNLLQFPSFTLPVWHRWVT